MRRLALGTFVCLVALLPLGAAPGAPPVLRARDALSDAEFWRLVTELSEPGGRFAPQLMSNEDSAQFVVPALTAAVRPGGVYLGVGSEPNFTYIAAIQPSLAFILDIRRDNLIQHLMYKALFELCPDRAAFVSRLFSRPRPRTVRPGASARELFDAFRPAASDPDLYEETRRAVTARLVNTHRFAVSPTDIDAISGFLQAFSAAGPDSLKGYGDGIMLTYAQLMAATDLDGRPHGFLESEDRYRVVRDLQRQNLIVPVVGDFAGDRALSGIGTWLRGRRLSVSAFYVSNVERYLFEQGPHGQHFYANVSTLPLGADSVFIRSVTTDISRRQAIPIPDGPARWRTFLSPIQTCLDGITSGRIQTYRDLFVASSPPASGSR